MQLPATLMSAHIKRNGLGCSAMQRLMSKCTMPHSMLTIQYRMHEQIASYPNERFYRNRIQPAEGLHNRESVLPQHNTRESDDFSREFHTEAEELLGTEPGEIAEIACKRTPEPELWLSCHYCFVDLQGTERYTKSSNSASNEPEASFIVKVIKHLLDSNDSLQISVLTFYKAQVKLIEGMIASTGLDTNKNIRVNTVDSFQGSECDVCILSFVRTTTTGFVNDFQRLNVALTRAKHMHISVGFANVLASAEIFNSNEPDAGAIFKSMGESLKTTLESALRDMVYDAYYRGCLFQAEKIKQVLITADV